MSDGAVGVLLLNDPARSHGASGDRSASRAWEADGADFCDATSDWLVDRIAGFWWTNISGYTLYEAGFSRRTDLKDDAFLCSRMGSIVEELGLSERSGLERAQTLSRLLNRVLVKSREALGLELLPAERSLPKAIRKRFFRSPSTLHLAPAARLALEEVVQPVTFAGRGNGNAREFKQFALRHNRAHYAARLMEAKVPYGAWVEISPPSDPVQAVEWAKNLLEGRPLLINCEVTFRGPRAHDLALLANMGSGAAAVMSGRRANLRSWVAGPEFLVLSQLADIKIRGVLAADRYVSNPWSGLASASEIGPDGAVALVCGPLVLRGRSLLEYDTGLIAECCAFALTAGDAADAISAWIVSHDRAFMLATCAEILHGFSPDECRVSGFARGRVWIRVPTEDVDGEEVLARVAEICAAGRLVPPLMPAPSGPASAKRIEIGRRVSHEVNARKDLELMPAVAAILGSRAGAFGV